MPSWLMLIISVGSILIIGGILVLIGIMGENITRLRNHNVELKGEIKHLQKKNNELEKELMKYDKKRKRNKE
jgi:hypothetical protein